MDVPTVVSVLVVLSVASERLVEIVKGLFPALNKENPDPTKEGWRRAGLQVMAVAAGIITAYLARPALPASLSPIWNSNLGIFGLGLLASGGSGFWNSVLAYFLQLKELKKAEAVAVRKQGLLG
jgi:hypothetical protein